jgi:tRNA C32,U32 (ribose-2'-O)-methylase TrmJ
MFFEPMNKANAVTIASYKITEILAKKKKKKHFEDGNAIKECLVMAGHAIFNEFKKN